MHEQSVRVTTQVARVGVAAVSAPRVNMTTAPSRVTVTTGRARTQVTTQRAAVTVSRAGAPGPPGPVGPREVYLDNEVVPAGVPAWLRITRAVDGTVTGIYYGRP